MEEKYVNRDPLLIDPPASRPGLGTAIWGVALVIFVSSIYHWSKVVAFFS